MLPNLMVIGAMKCGTTSLHSYLDLHPEITMSQPKELDYFVAEKNWSKGLEWYSTHFSTATPIRGESSPNYSKCHIFVGAAERMHAVVPDAKLIYVVRDPVERIISHYSHNVQRRQEYRSIERAMENMAHNNYVLCSHYFMQLSQYLNHFPEENISIVTTEELYTQRRATLQKVFRFLGVDDSFDSANFAHILQDSKVKRRTTTLGLLIANMPGKAAIKPWLPFSRQLRNWYATIAKRPVPKPLMSDTLRCRLIECLSADVAQLRQYTGCDFAYWCV